MLCAIPVDVGYLMSISRLIAKAVNFRRHHWTRKINEFELPLRI